MTKLNQIVAVESGVKSRVNETISEIYKAVQHPALFDGFVKKYQPLDEDGERFPQEQKLIQLRAEDVLKKVRSSLGELFDVTATKDLSNCNAVASVTVDGKVLLPSVPITSLLFLEKQLNDLHTLVSKLPVLDPNETWTFDTNANHWRSEPTETMKGKKVQKALVLHPATDKHPAQTQLITEDVTVGRWYQTKFSAALPSPLRDALVNKIQKLQKAVKFAREEANNIEAMSNDIGEKVFNWLLG